MPIDRPVSLTTDQITWLKQLKMSRRAEQVRDHILQYGAVTTQQLRDDYGYDHPPRAAMDLKDAGAGVVSVMIRGDNGKRMASYGFSGKANEDGAGRVVIPKAFSDALKVAYGYKCAICAGTYEGRNLQADHRIPFIIAGDNPVFVQSDFMPLCASDNRAKSWTCEHCPNLVAKDREVCTTCFWAHPEDYKHVATMQERRLTLTFQNEEVKQYDKLMETAEAQFVDITEIAKQALRDL